MISVREKCQPPFKEILQTNILEKLMTIITNHENVKNANQENLLYMTLWVLSNLLWEESVAFMIIEKNFYLILIKLLSYKGTFRIKN